MTLLDIRNQIVGTLCAKNSFAEADFAKVRLEKEHESSRKGLVLAALEELVTAGIVKKIVNESPDGQFDVATSLWVLSSPLNAQGQQVGLPMNLANDIAEFVNQFNFENDKDEDEVDSLSLHAGDIASLLGIALFYQDVLDEMSSEDNGDSPK